MLKKQLLNKLQIPYFEQNTNNKEVFYRTANKNKLLLFWVMFILFFTFFLLYVIQLIPEIGSWIYLYSFGLLFGNTIIVFFLLFFIWLLLETFFKFKHNIICFYLNRTQKMRLGDLRKKIYQLILISLILFLFIDHIILYFLSVNDFNFKPLNIKLLFENGWYLKFKLKETGTIYANDISIWNHQGFLFEWIINLFYVPTFSPIIPFLFIAFCIFYFFKKIFNFKFNFKKNRINLLEKIKLIKHEQNNLVYTKKVKDYYDFLLFACRTFVIDFRKINYKKSEKMVLKKVDDKLINDFFESYNILKSKTEEFDYNIENKQNYVIHNAVESKNDNSEWLDDLEFD